MILFRAHRPSDMTHPGAKSNLYVFSVKLLVLGLLIYPSNSTHHCSIIQAFDLESIPTITGLIGTTLNSSQNVTVIDYRIVCLSQGEERNTWRAVSLVANYTFNGTSSVSQFQFECVDSVWTATVNGSTAFTRTDPPDASLETNMRTDCAFCVDPRQWPSANNSQHCLVCDDSCSQGLQRCTSTLENTCCSYFLDDRCVSSCPNNSLPNSEFVCCPQGYRGENCSQDIDECLLSDPVCTSNGTCINTAGGFMCTCLAGFTGSLCEIQINECKDNSTCLNDANCTDTFGSYMCTCQPGFTGVNCGSNINECVNQPCQNEAECEDTFGSYVCSCLQGFTGIDCETNINECANQPCLNGGLCVDGRNAFSCNCSEGWAGSVCDECTLEGCAACSAGTGPGSVAVCNTCQEGFTLIPSSGICEMVSQPSGLTGGAIAGIIIALLLSVILMATLIPLVAVIYIKKRKRFSAAFRESHIHADQESSSHVMKNPVFQSPDLVEGADSGISIESDEHLAVNRGALEFEEDSDES